MAGLGILSAAAASATPTWLPPLLTLTPFPSSFTLAPCGDVPQVADPRQYGDPAHLHQHLWRLPWVHRPLRQCAVEPQRPRWHHLPAISLGPLCIPIPVVVSDCHCKGFVLFLRYFCGLHTSLSVIQDPLILLLMCCLHAVCVPSYRHDACLNACSCLHVCH